MGRRTLGEPLAIRGAEGDLTLRALLRILVDHELAEYASHRERSAALQILTPADLVRGAERGRYGNEGRELPPAPALDDAHARAIEAFDDQLFFAFLDDVRITDLDATHAIGPYSRLRLVRLVALTG
ncbi:MULTISPECIES: hypothetical protein [unclassified Microbacterium]|uniref:hypothetical protein n=1 Tax=unclassified Microbacterium TaxID=2609290 RepID=UPI00115F7ED7|nr:hypothetical protein [Microbacterium sp. LCT-H2]